MNELLSILNQNHSGAITDVFTSKEIDQLNLYFDDERPENTSNKTRLPGLIYAPENVNENFVNFQPATPQTVTIVGPSTSIEFEGAGTYNQFLEVFYVIDNDGNAYEIDPDTGVYTPFANVTAPAGESFTGLEFDPTTGTLYGISTDGAGSSTLSEINYETGEVTVIGNTLLVLAIAIAFDIAGIPYTYDIDTDTVYRLNKSNAEATKLGPIGFDANFGQGMYLDPLTNIINLTAFNNTTFQSELRTLNTDTGLTLFVGPLGSDAPGGTLQFGWSSSRKSTILSATENSITSFEVFPNPVSTSFQIKSHHPVEEIFIYNIMGQELKRITIKNENQSIDISNLDSGVYFVTLRMNGNQSTRRLIKK